MKNWSRITPALNVDLRNCIKLARHLRQVADIPADQVLWNRDKIEALKKHTKSRKSKFMVLFGLVVLAIPVTVAVYYIGIACALSGDECVSTMPQFKYQFVLVVSSLVTVALLLWKRSTGRNHYKTNFQEYYHPDLKLAQKKALTEEILKLKNNCNPIYEVGNYEKISELKSIFWAAENWFLILTEVEDDRSGIWLDGQIPLGGLVIQNKVRKNSPDSDSPWEKLQQPEFKYVVSNVNRLEGFIERKKKTSLVRNQPHWLEGFIRIQENYADYQLYLERKLTNLKRREFVGIFTSIFAEISTDKSKGEDDADLYEIGYKGATNFLRGRNTSMEDWIKSP